MDDNKISNELDRDLTLTKVNLIKSAPFFGYLVLSADIKFDNEITETACAGAESKIRINSEFFENINFNEKKGLLAHEVMHLALNHVHRGAHLSAVKWNIACDIVVNEILLANNLKLPKLDQCWTLQRAVDELGLSMKDGNDLLAESIYLMLPEDLITIMDLIPSVGNQSSDDQSINEKEIWEMVMSNAVTYAKEHDPNYGDMPGWLARVLQMNKPKVDWRWFLRMFAGSIQSDERSYANPSKRHQWRLGLLPSNRRSLPYIIAVIDTSGSISPTLLNSFSSEVFALCASGEAGIRLITHDADVTDDIEITSLADFPKELQGGGGTSFIPVIDKLSSEHEQPDGVIWLTDGWGDFPERVPAFPILWLITPHGDLPPEQFGWSYKLDELDVF